jgi:xanthine dehydrogenase YagT iron-sulfur-binding subunit
MGAGALAAGAGVLGPKIANGAPQDAVKPALCGPDPVPVTLELNGKKVTLPLEPRVTLLDALRNHLDLTGAKKVCDRATCGACTVLMDGKAVYSCTVLAIEGAGRKIETVEGSPRRIRASLDAALLRRERRAAMRLLHARLRDGVRVVPARTPEGEA